MPQRFVEGAEIRRWLRAEADALARPRMIKSDRQRMKHWTRRGDLISDELTPIDRLADERVPVF